MVQVWKSSPALIRTDDGAAPSAKSDRKTQELRFDFGRTPLWNCGLAAPARRSERQHHGHAAAVRRVFGVKSDEVAFLELDCEQNVCRGGDRKDQMRHRHQGSR